MHFLEQLLERIQAGKDIWYMDETSTSLWERPRRIWQPSGGIRIKLARQHKHNVTIIGALSYGKLFSRIAPRTNAETVFEFFDQMRREHELAGSVIVMDNHRAHWSHRVRDLLAAQGCELLFLPPASSILNPIEVVWAQVKRQWRQSLLSCDLVNVGEAWMVQELGRICGAFSAESLASLSSVHLREAIQVLQEASQHYEALGGMFAPRLGWTTVLHPPNEWHGNQGDLGSFGRA